MIAPDIKKNLAAPEIEMERNV